MKRVEIERQAIVRALEKERNITEAAQALGAARRTLQSRMRDYSIPPGKAGRPRELLPYASGGDAVSSLLVVGVAFGLGYWLVKRSRQQPLQVVGGAGGGKTECLRGLDLILAR